MEKGNTKLKIVNAALDLFSHFGYEAVSVEQIAGAIGIKAPSLYKHFKSKQDIFDAIFTEMEKRYDEQVLSMKIHLKMANVDTEIYRNISEDELIAKVKKLVEYSLHEEFVSKFRRLLTIEQFRSKAFSELYTKRYVQEMIIYHEQIFKQLAENGILKDEDAHIMSLQYVSPICILLGVCDRHPDKEKEVMELLERHIRQFNHIYRKREEK